MSARESIRASLSKSIILGLTLCLAFAPGCSKSPKQAFPDVVCRSPNGKRASKAVPQWKFDRIRGSILSAVPSSDSGIDFKELVEKIQASVPEAERKRLGKVSWLTETVALEMETRGELVRLPHTKTPLPKRVRRNMSSVE